MVIRECLERADHIHSDQQRSHPSIGPSESRTRDGDCAGLERPVDCSSGFFSKSPLTQSMNTRTFAETWRLCGYMTNTGNCSPVHSGNTCLSLPDCRWGAAA